MVGMLRDGQRVRVNLAGLRVGSVVFQAAVIDAVGTIVRQVSQNPPTYLVKLLRFLGPLYTTPYRFKRRVRRRNSLLDLVLGELFRRELASLHVALVEFRILLPLLGKVVQRKNRGDRADWDTGSTIDAFHRINVQLGNVVERRTTVVITGVLLGVDTIYGTGVDAGGVFGSDARFGNDIGHRPPPAITIYGMPLGREIQAESR